jgi:hypothetical protein
MLELIYGLMKNSQMDDVMKLMDDFRISNEMFKEHLMDLCVDKKLVEKIQDIPSGTKAAFTRTFNKSHKSITAVKKGGKGAKNEPI